MEPEIGIYGFDSAWTDNPKQPGSISALMGDDKNWVFHAPRLARFDKALAFILAHPAQKQIIALDQPTIVNNASGIRPVERIAGSIVNKLGGGVQPANQGRANMFDAAAPVWRFIQVLQAIQNPFAARSEAQGRFLIEVFPALAIPSLVPNIWKRGRAAKYNPGQAAKFQLADWQLVCDGLIEFALDCGLPTVVEYLRIEQVKPNPTKSDQDRLDSVICTLIGFCWLKSGSAANCVIGDGHHGFMVTPALPAIHSILHSAAAEKSVPFNDPSGFSATTLATVTAFIPDTSQPTPNKKPKLTAAVYGKPLAKSSDTQSSLSYDAVYLMLIEAANTKHILTYGDVLEPFGIKANSFSVVGRLVPILNRIAVQNLQKKEPLLASLVVAKTTGIAGDGFFQHLGSGPFTDSDKKRLLKLEQAKVFDFDWSSA
jgi:predicted RNase H-like nuclease